MAGMYGIAASYRRMLKKKTSDFHEKVFNGSMPQEQAKQSLGQAEEDFLKDFQATMRLTCKLMVIVKEERKLAGLDKESDDSLEGAVLTDKYWYLLTVRPPPDICFSTFKYKIEAFIGRSMIKSAEYSYEQVGESLDELGKGFHCHVVLNSPYPPSKLLEIINKDFAGWHSVVGKEHQKYLKTDKDLLFARNYIRGDKHNDLKTPAVILNNAWREKLKLEALYISP